jgi:hypothetical protein
LGSRPLAVTGARFHASVTKCSGLSGRPYQRAGGRMGTVSIWPPARICCSPTVSNSGGPRRPFRPRDRRSSITLSADFFEQLVASPVPLDLRAVRVLKQSPLALDLYAWATRRVSYLERPTLISWEALRRSFGTGYADTPQGRVKFRARVLDALGRVCRVYSSLRLEIEDDGVLLLPSAPHIPRIAR